MFGFLIPQEVRDTAAGLLALFDRIERQYRTMERADLTEVLLRDFPGASVHKNGVSLRSAALLSFDVHFHFAGDNTTALQRVLVEGYDAYAGFLATVTTAGKHCSALDGVAHRAAPKAKRLARILGQNGVTDYSSRLRR